MKASPILISWHNENQPVYSTHIDGKGRLATAGGDNNVRIWRLTAEGDERKVEYLTTLIKVRLLNWASPQLGPFANPEHSTHKR